MNQPQNPYNVPPVPSVEYAEYEVISDAPHAPPMPQPQFIPPPAPNAVPPPIAQKIPIVENPATVQVISQQQATTEIVKFDQFNNADQMLNLAKVLVAGRMVPFKTPEECVTAILMAHDLGVGAGVAMNNIYNIEGKASLSSHLVGYLIQRAGIEMETIKNYQHIYDSNGQWIDTEHEITFHKYSKLLKRPISYVQRLTWSQVVAAGWHKNRSWQKIPMVMLPYRCRVIGARIFDPGCLLGFHDITEAADAAGIQYDVDAEENAIIIN